MNQRGHGNSGGGVSLLGVIIIVLFLLYLTGNCH